jgi:hypothetical protein
MPVQKPNTKDAGTMTTPWLSDLWIPAMTGCAASNTKAHQACIDLSVEWQAFVGRRIGEDFHLLQELSAAKAPDEIWNTWSRFWQKAADDYGKEYSVLAKLATGFVPSIAPISQDDFGGDTMATRPQPQSKAA